MATILTAWEGYLNAVVPEKLNEYQKERARVDFYSGAHAMLMILEKVSQEKFTEDISLTKVSKLHQEFQVFITELGGK